MERIVQKANTLWGLAVAVLSGIFGEFWFLFASFLALNATDYATGIVKAKLTRTENSNKGLRGIIKKVGYWVVIALAFFISLSFEKMGRKIGLDLSFVRFFGWFTLATFIINEIRSILENLVLIGVDVPKFLLTGLEVAAKAVDGKASGEKDE